MMIDLGKKNSGVECCAPSEDKKDKKYYPGLYIDGNDFDFPKSMFGKDIEVKAIVRLKGQTQRKDDKGDMKGSIDLEVRKIDFGHKEKSIGDAMMEAMEDAEDK